MKNPIMFVLEIVSALTTIIFVRDLIVGNGNLGFTFQIILWLWFTVLFANFAEAIAEGRGKAQADSLRQQRHETQAKLMTGSARNYKLVPGVSLKVGDVVLVEAGDTIPSDGEVVEGIASVNEVGHHRRIRARHPRIRWRSLCCNGRHAGTLRLDHRSHHRRTGFHLP